MTAATMINQPSTNDRWERALTRARNDGIRLRATSEVGRYQVVSGDRTYFATVDVCSCTAGQHGDPVCKHRAAVRSAEKLANAAKPQQCATCAGHGWVSGDGGYSAYRCVVCDGRGSVPALRIVVSNDEPEPTPPAAPVVADELAEAYADLARNHDTLCRYQALLDRDGRMSERDWQAFDRAGNANRAIHDRIRDLTSQLSAQNVQVAA